MLKITKFWNHKTSMQWKIFLAINRIRMLFADGTGHTRNPYGTGFWINVEEDVTALVTNAHNIDARYKLGADTKYEFKKIEIELRNINETGKLQNETEFHEIEFEHIIQHNSADVGILINPSYASSKEKLFPNHIAKEEIATHEDFESSIGVCDAANFIGFATYVQNGKSYNLWDTTSNLPIIRPANIASIPHLDFKNQAIHTSDVCLVSGLSFSGSSGSPAFSRQKDAVFNYETQCLHGGIAKAKLIGIMSGHIWDEPREEEIHSGISYFTKSTAIHELIESYYTKDFGPANSICAS